MESLAQRLLEKQRDELLKLRDQIERRTGLSYQRSRLHQLANRVARRMVEGRFNTLRRYSGFLRGGPTGEEEFDRLVESLLVKESSFFRNAPQFHVLREYILPAVISNKRFADQRRLTVWSAGCSHGQEPYSLALTLLDVLGPRSGWELTVYATDISRRAVESVQRGRYRTRELEGVPEEFRQRYFRRIGEDVFEISGEVRRHVQPLRGNLLRTPAFGNQSGIVDILFCRNVLIYFDVPTIRRITDVLERLLADDGYLFLGHSESLFGITDRFRLVDFAGLLIYRKALGRRLGDDEINDGTG